MRVTRWIVSLVLSTFLGLGCQPQEIVEGGKPNPKPVKTLISLSPSTTEIAATAGLYSQLKGRTAACNYPTTVAQTPVVAGVKPDYDKIAAIKPDLAIYDPNLFSATDIKKLEDLKIETFPIAANSVEEFIDALYRFGSRTGSETSVSTYVDRILDIMRRTQAEPVAKEVTCVILLPGRGGEHMVAGTESFQADVLKIARAKVLGPPGTKFVPLNAEQLIGWNPDFVVSAGDPTSLLQDPRFQSLQAFKNKRIRAINQDVVLRAGSRVDKFIEAAAQIVATQAKQ
jgi:iron complex transport system substrate-binding protein